jgi:AcrR family transcriptional regulator
VERAVRKTKPKATTLGRAPKQLRSRESFERVIQAATAILRETGHADFTLSEVSRRSRASIGSIYGRVDSKEELVRVVQHRVFEQVDREFAEIVNKIRRRSLPLRQLVPVLVRDLAEMLRSYGNIFSAMIETSAHDPQVAATGKRHYAEQALDFKLLLLERRNEIVHPDPEHAATFAFALVYGMIARHLGFGTRDAAGEGDWRQLVDDLGTTCLALLLTDPDEHRGSAR